MKIFWVEENNFIRSLTIESFGPKKRIPTLKMYFMDFLSESNKLVLNEMLHQSELTNLHINSSFRVHAIVLAQLSNKLRTKIQNCSGTLKLPYSNEVINQIIKVAYEGAENMNIKIQLVEDLINFGLQYQVKQIISKCGAFLVSNVNAENVCDFIKLSKPLPKDYHPIEKQLFRYAAVNVKELGEALLHLTIEDIVVLLRDCNLDMSQAEAEHLIRLWSLSNKTTKQGLSKLQMLAKMPTSSRIPKMAIFTIGGWEDEPSGRTEMFNFLTSQWIEVNALRLPQKSFAYHSLEVMGKYLYLIGGFSVQEDGSQNFQNCLFRFDMEKKTWDRMSSMNSKRCYISTVTANGKIYAIGGHSGGQIGRLASAEVYDPDKNQWDFIASMNSPRSDFSCVYFKGSIYACGGFDGSEYLSQIEKYDIATNTWEIVTHLTTPRSGSSAVVVGDKIMVFGGFDGTERLKSVECFTPGLSRYYWHPVPDMVNRRSNFAACAIKNDSEVFVVGGFKKNDLEIEGQVCSDVEIYHPSAGQWKTAPPLNFSRSALASIYCENIAGFN